MSAVAISLITLAFVFGGALLGIFLRTSLPAIMTVAAETLGVLTRPTRDEVIPIVGQVLTYGGALSFIVFIRACGELRRN